MVMKKICVLILLLSVVCMTNISSASWLWWTNGAANNQWTDTGNWTAYPTSGDDVVVGTWDTTGPILYTGQTGYANWMHVTDTTATGSKVTVSGGTLNVNDHLFLGQWDSGAKGTLEINSGVVNTNLLMCGGDTSGTVACQGVLEMNGGQINISWLLAVAGGYSGTIGSGVGHIQLDGGVINVTGGGGLLMSNNGSMDITNGAIILNGEITDIASYGNVTAFGGEGSFVYDYQDGRTTITALIPEPATLVLIGLGALILKKK
ncbi:MAG: PEP-CTERM sorting domain-containing protein [Phycisphaerales bacterium]